MKKTSKKKMNFIFRIIDEDISKKKCDFIRTRFAPEPNGYLHIGHAKSLCLNFDIARNYFGEFYLRFDDTNPINERMEYINSIKEDMNWLGFRWDGMVKYTSDYFDILYKYAVDLIKKGLAYVDELSLNDIKKYRGTLNKTGKNSPYRNRTIDENLMLFDLMRSGKFKEKSACLRAKINMSSKIIIMRDPILYRIIYKKHYKLKKKWCIYPTYDFSHCISDAIEGITHSLCTLEFQNNRFLYDWILSSIKIKSLPKQYEFSRLNLSYTVMSKRKLNNLVLNNIVDGWDDPRMPTISGLRRRGYTAKSIRKFCRNIGITKKDSVIKTSLLESYIRFELNKYAPRVMVVLDPIKLIIENMSEDLFVLKIRNHPNNPKMGFRKVFFTREIYIDRSDFKEKADKKYKRLVLGKSVRLSHACVIQANSFKRDVNGNISTVYCTFDVNTLNKKYVKSKNVVGIIHWVSKLYCLKAEIRLYDNLFNKYNLNEKDLNDLSVINPNSCLIKEGRVENSLMFSMPGKHYQFEREGYFVTDIKDHNSKNLVFNRTVKLRDNFLNY